MECNEKLETAFLSLFHEGQSHLTYSSCVAVWLWEYSFVIQEISCWKWFLWGLNWKLDTALPEIAQANTEKHILLCLCTALLTYLYTVMYGQNRQLMGEEICIYRLTDYIHPEWSSPGLYLNLLLKTVLVMMYDRLLRVPTVLFSLVWETFEDPEHEHLLNLMRFTWPHFSHLFRCLWMTFHPSSVSTAPLSLLSSANLWGRT